MKLKQKTTGKRGRPKCAIKCKSDAARKFFETADSQELSIGDLERILKEQIDDAPSYRTLQEWRRGTHYPKYVQFGLWKAIVLQSRNRNAK